MDAIERKIKENGMDNAFPDEFSSGLNKREWFAGMALQGMLANPGNTSIDGCVAMSIFAADGILKQLAESDGAK